MLTFHNGFREIGLLYGGLGTHPLFLPTTQIDALLTNLIRNLSNRFAMERKIRASV